MAATLVSKETETSFEKTVEPANEVTMETQAVTVETEQPRAAPSPSFNGQGHDRPQAVVMETGSASGSLTSSSMKETDLGTSVDSLIKLQSSVETLEMSDTGDVGQEPVLVAGPSPNLSICSKGFDVMTEAPLASQDSLSSLEQEKAHLEQEQAHLKQEMALLEQEKAQLEQKNANLEQEKAHIVEAFKESEVKVDKLAALSAQIDDFDPSELFGKKDVEKVGADNESVKVVDLIDSFIQDLEVEGGEVRELNDDDYDYGNNDEDEIDETEHVDDGVKTDNVKGKCVTNDSLSKKDENEYSDEKVNGGMSNSTESDGFNEEAVNGSANHEKSETKAPEGIEIKAKTAAVKVDVQKSESGQPPKLKSKKKEDKGIEHILKALSSLQTTEEKLAALCKKYADLHEEHRVVQSTFKQTQRKLTVTTREKDQLQTEHTKAVMAKSKLENLCRELQKHNQTIRQESIQRAKEEDEKRKEISQKFQTTIGEIQTQMGENHERNKQLREENADLAGKLKKFIEQSEAREMQVAKVIQHRELEQKLADAKLEQATAILQEEQGRSQKERELLILQSTEYFKKLQLKDQELNMYKERYDEFQSTIKKSEEMFGKFKTEMDKMGKRCKKLEKDGAQWKTKWEGGNRALLEMAEEKQKYDRERGLLVNKITKLESLCRAMQAERQARKLLESEKMSVTQELANLGLTKDSLPPPD